MCRVYLVMVQHNTALDSCQLPRLEGVTCRVTVNMPHEVYYVGKKVLNNKFNLDMTIKTIKNIGELPLYFEKK